MATGGSRRHELDFGPLEKQVRWLEECLPEAIDKELPKKLGRGGSDPWEPWLRIGAFAAVRSARADGPRAPQGLPTLSGARALGNDRPGQEIRPLLLPALRLVNREVNDPGFAPSRLFDCAEVAGEGREGTLFAFLEAVRAGETEWADHRFAWLVRNLEKEQVIDLLLSSGLEGVAYSADCVVLVVETVALLQTLGWESAPFLLRSAVRHQARGRGVPPEYERCREVVEKRELLRLARRRSPGQPAWGERDPEAFLAQSVHWAESGPPERMDLVARLLADGVTQEDVADQLALGAALLFLQEILSRREGALAAGDMEASARLYLGVLALCRLVRLGTPGQRILGLLLAAWVPPAREARLQTRNADRTWWLPSLAPAREPAPRDEAGPAVPEAWTWLIEQGQPNGLLPLLTERLESGNDAGAFEQPLVPVATRLETVPGFSIRLVRAFGEAYRGSRTPHRWMHLWAAALALALWPRSEAGSG